MNKSHKGIMFFAIIFIIGICSVTGYVMLDRLGENIFNNSTSDINLNNWKIALDIDDSNKHLSLSTKDLLNNEKKAKRNSLKEVGEGFDILKNKLPKWIDETKKEIENVK